MGSSKVFAATMVLSSLAGLQTQAWAGGTECARLSQEAAAQEAAAKDGRPTIQVAILLDTSGSMDGLINQARARIWDVVNDLGKARKNGQKPVLNIALYQYGSDDLPSSEGFLRCVQPFTTDLDAISDRLFALRINGQAEYCGMVMDSALKQLSWDSTSPTAPVAQQPLRVMIIAGNEEFTQGPKEYAPVVKAAKERGVYVNTVYCGAYVDGERTGWLNGAYLNGGSYSCIDQGAALPEVATPYDADLLRLNTELNQTYALYYGSAGRMNQERQRAQDSTNMAASPSGMMSRVSSKASYQYRNDHWDLVDYVDGGKDISTIPTADLPDELKPLTVEQRKARIEELRVKRNSIRAQVVELEKKRQEHIRKERTKPAHGETLDSAIIKAVREQAVKLGFTFEKD